jgi:hypothetical protein
VSSIIHALNNPASDPIEKITGKIFMLRGEKVMLDRDLAEL